MSTRKDVVFPDVLVVDRSDSGWFIEIDGRRVFVGQLQVAPGARMPGVGTRGPVTLTQAAAHDLKLTPPVR